MAEFILLIKGTKCIWDGRTWTNEWINRQTGDFCQKIVRGRNIGTGRDKKGGWRNIREINDGNWWKNKVWFTASVNILLALY